MYIIVGGSLGGLWFQSHKIVVCFWRKLFVFNLRVSHGLNIFSSDNLDAKKLTETVALRSGLRDLLSGHQLHYRRHLTFSKPQLSHL